MKSFKYRIRFLTPTFLGDADQKAQWRTPPIKAELRRWWRVVYAAGQHFKIDVNKMRQQEALLFGTASGNQFKSLLQMRLSGWRKGTLTTWSDFGVQKIRHPEVPKPVDPYLYLGFGPLLYRGGKTVLIRPPAISAGEEAELWLRIPDQYSYEIDQALALMMCFGSVGGRSRNGWGAFELRPLGKTALPEIDLKKYSREWTDALGLDWPHAIGCEGDRPLVWRTKNYQDWNELMRVLAEIKVKLRTQFKFQSGNNAPIPEDRHWLAYPVTKHSVRAWGHSKRLPNALRFTVKSNAEGQIHGVIYHMPWLPPKDFEPKKEKIESVWQRVHTFLNNHTELTAYYEGGCQP